MDPCIVVAVRPAWPELKNRSGFTPVRLPGSIRCILLVFQQQQQGLNLTSGFKTAAAPAEVGLNLSLQNGINLSRNPDRTAAQGQQQQGGAGGTAGTGSYYYTSNVTSGYINLSTQKYPIQVQ